MNFDHSPIMDDPYQYFLTSMSRVGPQAIAEYPTIQGQAFLGVSGETPPFNEPPITGHSQDTQELVVLDGSKSKGRKKSTVANPGDVVKHRRTRSGCFTCRSRRVKVGYPSWLLRGQVANSSSVTRIDRSANVGLPDTCVFSYGGMAKSD
jgi:hypothetical protein